jgi:hypothetical protein
MLLIVPHHLSISVQMGTFPSPTCQKERSFISHVFLWDFQMNNDVCRECFNFMFFLAWGVRVMFWENMFNTTNYLGMQMVALAISMQIWFEMFLEIVKGSFVNNYGNKLMTSKGLVGRSIINFGVHLFEKLWQLWGHFGYSFWGFTKIEVKRTMRHDYWDLVTWIMWYDIYVNHTLNHMPN